MAEKIGFEKSGEEWEGPISLVLELDQKHDSVRYIGNLSKQRFSYYPPMILLKGPTGSGFPDRILVTIGRAQHSKGEVRFQSEVRVEGEASEHVVYSFYAEKSNSVRYETRDVDSNRSLYIPFEVFRGKNYPKRVYLTVSVISSPPQEATALGQDEGLRLEYKSSARWDYKLGQKSREVEHAIQKTVAAFLNTEGGDLFIGVADDKTILGVEKDYDLVSKKGRDGYELFLSDLIFKSLGSDLVSAIKTTVLNVEGKDVWRITCAASTRPVYLKDPNGVEQLYIRRGNSTIAVSPKEAIDYSKNRWPK